MKVRLVDSAAHPVRLAFAQHLFEAGTVGGEGKPAFSMTAILPKDHPQIKELHAAEVAVAKEKWGAKADANLKCLALQASWKRATSRSPSSTWTVESTRSGIAARIAAGP